MDFNGIVERFFCFFMDLNIFFLNIMDVNGFVEWISVDLCIMDFADLAF